ncbi:MAG TPA: sulfite exporter TauE/SafE family protein [Trebonia sp.]|nr:sulfite exporter TauE/SafE family protein [Trebonia sp.]
MLIAIGALTGLTTVLFGFGGGFVTVPVIVWADAGLGPAAAHVAVATSSVVMVVNACVATAATDRAILRQLRGTAALLVLLAVGGAVGTVAVRWVPGIVTQWAFVAYLAITITDLLLRPGFFRPRPSPTARSGLHATARPDTVIPVVLGVPIGAIAAFLGVGGSVMTVPLLRRSGRDMRTATSLANPLTLAMAVPAMAIFLSEEAAPGGRGAVFLAGSVDLGAAAALLAGALPVIITVRRRRPRIPDGLYSWSYLALLVLVTAAMVIACLRHG